MIKSLIAIIVLFLSNSLCADEVKSNQVLVKQTTGTWGSISGKINSDCEIHTNNMINCFSNSIPLIFKGPWFSPNYGTPDQDILTNVVNEINHATNSICMQAYSFTQKAIEAALTNAFNRGVKVTIIADPLSTNREVQLNLCMRAGILCLIDYAHKIAHNKVMIIDGKEVLTGSYNWTEAAEHLNAENEIGLLDPGVVAYYITNWNKHLSHSVIYKNSGSEIFK